MMSLTFGLFTQVSGSGPLGPLVVSHATNRNWDISFAFLAALTRGHKFCWVF